MTKKPSKTSEHAFRPGDIIVVPFPYSDQLAEKRRPALVVSSRKFNAESGLLWTVMITSATHKKTASDITLPPEISDLPKPSLIRTSKIATIEPHRVVRKLKTLEGEKLTVVRQKISEVISRN